MNSIITRLADLRAETLGHAYDLGFPATLLLDLGDTAELLGGIAYDYKQSFWSLLVRAPRIALGALEQSAQEWLA